tara:strand:- start:10353 stop:10634 length:282 start_codon:yes stop_codon:yes gene_type:complete
MKVKEIMERIGITETGRAIAYIKDALEEMNTMSETHMKTQRVDLKKDKRFYDIPSDAIQIKDIRAKNHLNSKDEYRSIPRLIYKPNIKDADGI